MTGFYYATFDSYDEWEREQDARAEKAAQDATWAEMLQARGQPSPPSIPAGPPRDELGRFTARPGRPPSTKRLPKGTSRWARGIESWRRRAARGLSARCAHCDRRTLPHHAKGYCTGCYKTATGKGKAQYFRRKESLRAWKKAHPKKCREYNRRYIARPEIRRRRIRADRARYRRQQLEKLRLSSAQFHREREAWKLAT